MKKTASLLRLLFVILLAVPSLLASPARRTPAYTPMVETLQHQESEVLFSIGLLVWIGIRIPGQSEERSRRVRSTR